MLLLLNYFWFAKTTNLQCLQMTVMDDSEDPTGRLIDRKTLPIIPSSVLQKLSLPESNETKHQKNHKSMFSSWWLNQPIWKILDKMGSSSPNRGEKIKNSWVATTQLFFLKPQKTSSGQLKKDPKSNATKNNSSPMLGISDVFVLAIFFIFSPKWKTTSSPQKDPCSNQPWWISSNSPFAYYTPQAATSVRCWKWMRSMDTKWNMLDDVYEYMDVSENSGKTHPNHPMFNRVFHYNPSILG